ncbi:MAG: hypothetical protein NTY90_01740 [Candidatus Micrarchaeota archaeon]|nr:hypothetical protein [Candidatus Micrarchaeota archaeon]
MQMDARALEKMVKTAGRSGQATVQNLILLEILREMRGNRSCRAFGKATGKKV